MIRRCRWLIGLFLLTCQLGIVHALEVGLLLSRNAGADLEVAETIGRFASNGGSEHSITLVGSMERGIDPALLARADLVVAIGVAAANHMARQADKPTMAVLVSRQQFAAVHRDHPGANLSAIVLDHPPERQIALARAILPELRRLGIVVGPDGAAMAETYLDAASSERIALQVRNIFGSNELLPTLEKLLQVTDMIMVLPDPMTAQAGAIRSILLSSYRTRRPVLAYSQAYVEAGALAAIFSTPRDIGRDVTHWLNQLAEPLVTPGSMLPPTHFGIAINRRVARVLNLDIVDDQTILSRISAGAAP